MMNPVIQPSYLSAVAESYDAVAEAYLERVPRPEEMDELSRAMLASFARRVRGGGGGQVADVGCGPGLITGYLASELGLSVFGIDLSPRMVELARSAFPELRFEVGSMSALDVADGSLAGVVAWYSTHHVPFEAKAGVFAEFCRVLAPGGHLLVGTHVSDPEQHIKATQGYGGIPVSYESFLQPSDRLAELVRSVGLDIVATLVEAREDDSRRGYGCLVARKPAG